MPATVDRQERKIRREEKRAKQRETSITRAETMHKARLAHQSALEFDDHVAVKGEHPAYQIGCSGWFYWHWGGVFYPNDLPRNEWFEYYASQFNTVELNAPFYCWPTVATVKSWRRQAGRRRFIYTVKVCERITHTKRFRGTKELVKDFGYIADLLGPYMGCFLFQLPPSYQYTPARLRTIVNQLESGRRNVVEFRHSSWWNDTVYAAFQEHGIIFCCCSGPKLPDILVKTTDEIYIRFHGPKRWYRHDYSKEEIAEWAQRIRDSGASQVWAYFNNDNEGYAIKNAHALLKRLKQLRSP
ncbi:MAG: hypothetical protein K0S45_3781 [Nitrospira sp.]|nr:hypothetical protein [Nitrospira sp.]